MPKEDKIEVKGVCLLYTSILGIRPGRPTAEFIGRTARRLNWFESVFLAILVLMPSVLGLSLIHI